MELVNKIYSNFVDAGIVKNVQETIGRLSGASRTWMFQVIPAVGMAVLAGESLRRAKKSFVEGNRLRAVTLGCVGVICSVATGYFAIKAFHALLPANTNVAKLQVKYYAAGGLSRYESNACRLLRGSPTGYTAVSYPESGICQFWRPIDACDHVITKSGCLRNLELALRKEEMVVFDPCPAERREDIDFGELPWQTDGREIGWDDSIYWPDNNTTVQLHYFRPDRELVQESLSYSEKDKASYLVHGIPTEYHVLQESDGSCVQWRLFDSCGDAAVKYDCLERYAQEGAVEVVDTFGPCPAENIDLSELPWQDKPDGVSEATLANFAEYKGPIMVARRDF